VRRCAQHAGADGVKGSGPHPGGFAAQQPADALAHLARGLVGERDRENLPRVDAFDVDQASDARRQHARLARSRAGENEQWSIDVQHSLALRRVQAGGQFFFEQHRHQ
jgi:hypothetical protein